MQPDEQQFLNNLDKKLWTSADKLRSTLDASQYKHTVLGMIFLKYVSDSFDIRRKELSAQLRNPDHDYYLDPTDFGGEDSEEYQAEINEELEQRDYYTEANVFWVPKVARWEFLQNQNKVVITGEIEVGEGNAKKKIRSVGQLIDNALDAIEVDNPKLKGVLNKRYTQLQIDQAKLGELIDLVATIPFAHDSLSSKDILGHVYEYFLGQFALAEGKKGGQFYTPKSIVAILDEAFAGIDTAIVNTEKNLANARELFESNLQKIFSQHEEGWKVKPLESFSTIVNGFAFKSGDFSPQNEVKSIKITNVGVYEFVQESDNYLPQDYLEKYSQYKAYEGDIVVALTRTIISSGLKVAVVPADYDGALINQRVAAVHVNEEVMPKQVLQAFLSTKKAIDYVRSNVNELMQPNLSIKDLKAFPIPVPPADKKSYVSSQIAEINEQTDRLASLYSSKLDSLNELKQSLLQKTFSGELTAEVDKLKEEAVA